jgi:hypothetical protein
MNAPSNLQNMGVSSTNIFINMATYILVLFGMVLAIIAIRLLKRIKITNKM